jgi:hypothetical protein
MRWLKNTILAIGIATIADGADVRTISFSLPEERMVIDLVKANSSDTAKLSVRRENFGDVVSLDPGTYRATLGALGKSADFVIPPTGSSYILLVFASKTGPFTIVPIANDTDKIPYQTYHVINALGTDVFIDYNEQQKVKIAPAKSHTFQMPSLQLPNNVFPVRMYAAYREGDTKPTQFFLASWRSKTDRRYITLIYKDPLFFKPLVRSIPDFKLEPAGADEE